MVEDYQLVGYDLEKRVKSLLSGLGWDVRPGRPNKEDLVVHPLGAQHPKTPIAIEIRSWQKEKRAGPHSGDLRQLDERIYESQPSNGLPIGVRSMGLHERVTRRHTKGSGSTMVQRASLSKGVRNGRIKKGWILQETMISASSRFRV